MDKKDFNKLPLIEQINYFNSLLLQGQTKQSIVDNLGIARSTINERYAKIGYRYSDNFKAYVSVKDEVMQIPHKDGTKPLAKQEDTRNTIIGNTTDNIKNDSVNVSNNSNGNMGGNKSNSIVINKTVNKDKAKRVSYYLNVSTIRTIEQLAKQSNKGISEFVQTVLDATLPNVKIE